MELEGLINHALVAYNIEIQYIVKQLADNEEHLQFWKEVHDIHANEAVQEALREVNNIRQMLGSESCMAYLIKKDAYEPLCFMGFPLKTIEFYLHLKSSLQERPDMQLDE